MVKLSREHSGQRTKAPAEFDAPHGADEIWKRRPVRVACRIWPAMGLALLAFANPGARAQQTPAIGDIYESGGEPVYSDTYESDCESRNNTNIWKGMNPLLYRGEVGSLDPSGKCGPDAGPLKFWKQVGKQCLYLIALTPPLTNSIVIPFDDLGAAENQGFKCGGDPADVCMVICSGPGKFKPPPGTELLGTPPATKSLSPTPAPKTPTPIPAPKTPAPAPGPCKKQPGTATADDLVTALYKYYRSQQFTKWGAAYMVGSLMWESQGLNPDINEIGGGPGYGLGQWTNKGGFKSYTALQCYAQLHGKPISDFSLQAHFTVQQRTNITDLFKTAQNAQQAQNDVTQFENYGDVGASRWQYGATICKNVVCSKAPPSKFFDDPKVGVPAGKGLGVYVSKALGSGADLSNLIQDLQCPWTEPADLKESMKTCVNKASSK